MNAAIGATEGLELRIVVAVMDQGGNLAGLLRMGGSFLASSDYTQWKAWTAASFSILTHDFAAHMDNESAHVRDGIAVHQQVSCLPGGIPLFKDGVLVGAIGVSGGTGEQDISRASAGADAITG